MKYNLYDLCALTYTAYISPNYLQVRSYPQFKFKQQIKFKFRNRNFWIVSESQHLL